MHKKTSIICANLWQTSHVVGAQRNRLNEMTPIISQNTSNIMNKKAFIICANFSYLVI